MPQQMKNTDSYPGHEPSRPSRAAVVSFGRCGDPWPARSPAIDAFDLPPLKSGRVRRITEPADEAPNDTGAHATVDGAAMSAGMTVTAADGRSLGTVGALRPGYVMVRPRFGARYWIPDVLVREVTRQRGATLHLGGSSLRRYKDPLPERQPRLLYSSATARRCCLYGVTALCLVTVIWL